MKDPLVSIIIPTFNRAAFLPATLESVLAQDYAQKEIIVVDDGSADGTFEVCKKYPVRYMRQENRGLSAARNLGVAHCTGDLLVFIDDDDLSPAGSVTERALQWQQDPGCAFILGRTRRFTGEPAASPDFTDPEEGVLLFSISAALIMRSVYEALNGMDEALHIGESEDQDFWQRLREAGHRHKFIQKVCLFYRRHSGSSTRDARVRQRGMLKTLHGTIMRRRQREGNNP